MGIDILGFFIVAASLVLLGFASGPVVARKVHATQPRPDQRSHLYH